VGVGCLVAVARCEQQADIAVGDPGGAVARGRIAIVAVRVELKERGGKDYRREERGQEPT